MLNNKFAKPYGWTIIPITVTAGVLVLIALYYSILMWMEISNFEQKIIQLNTTTKQFQNKTQELKNRNTNTPTKTQVAELETKLFRLSQIFVEAKSSVLVLFNKLEKIIPKSVYIEQINHDGSSAKTTIVAVAKNIEGISSFLEKLEADDNYVSVLLKRQSHIKIKNKEYIEFEILIDEQVIK